MELNALMNRFRNASRELFNHYFHASTHDEEAGSVDERYSIIEEQLFHALVTEPANIKPILYGRLQSQILVTLRNGNFAPWMLNRELDSGYWDHSQKEVTTDAVLQFIRYFDWDQFDFKDHHYVRVLVTEWPSHPEHVGKHALIESMYVQFVKADAQTA